MIFTVNIKAERNSNLELFRIIAMLAIIAHHFVVNSGLTATNGAIYSQITNWRSVFLLIFGAWGKVGINCFILITGYFMCENSITIRKYSKLLAQIYLYKIAIYIILFFAGYETFSARKLIWVLSPISSVNWNFVDCFLVFFLCIPFLTILVRNLTEKMHGYLLALLGIVYIVFPTLLMPVTFNYVTWFCVLFFIASYVRLYPKKIYANTRFWGLTSIVMLFIAVASVYVCSSVFTRLEITPSPFYFVADSNKLLAVAVAFSLFMFFSTVKIKYNKWINVIASTTFGVLLIHASSNAMRTWLWKDFIDCVGHYETKYLPIYATVSVLGVFAVCSLIDLARITLFEKPFLRLFDKIISRFANNPSIMQSTQATRRST